VLILRVKAGERREQVMPEGWVKEFSEEELRITQHLTYPNPFMLGGKHQWCVIRCDLTREAEIEVYIYTLLGRGVWYQKVGGKRGVNEIWWDGRNGLGEIVNSGVYIYKLKVRAGREVVSATGRIGVVRSKRGD
jgi:hypothetical protein